MKLLKTILSIFMLSIYMVGFGHSLTPHCQSFCGEESESTHEHKHEHHEHASNDEPEHEHIEHNNHLDENWVDYLLCLVSDFEHHGSGCHAPHFLVEKDNFGQNEKSKEKSANDKDVIAGSIEIEQIGQLLVEVSSLPQGPPERSYSNFHLAGSTLRGPPFYSC